MGSPHVSRTRRKERTEEMMKVRTAIKWECLIVAAVAFSAATACTLQAQDEPFGTQESELISHSGTSVWPAAASGLTEVPVCFSPPDVSVGGRVTKEVHEHMRKWMQDGAELWEIGSNLRFVDWQTCATKSPPGIVIDGVEPEKGLNGNCQKTGSTRRFKRARVAYTSARTITTPR